MLRDKTEVVRVPFAAGQTRMRWTDIPALPKTLTDGLPPGVYTLRKEGTPFEAAFTVEAPERRAEVLRHSAELDRLLNDLTNPLAVQAAVTELLAQTDDTGKKPRPYLADALDRLESVPETALTPSLKRTRDLVLRRFLDSERAATVNAPEEETTGVPEIDRVRDLIAAGQWEKASEVLDAMRPDDSAAGRRAAALASLYRGVILAEAGRVDKEQASAAFRQALRGLEGGAPADVYRAHNDFANYYLGRAQDRIDNQAVQSAAGVRLPFLAALHDWAQAREHYQAALELADQLSANQRRAVRGNLARRGPFEMVRPKFLVDEPFDLCYAPSLTSWDLLRRVPVRPLAGASALGLVAVPGAPELPGVGEDLKNLREAFAGKVGEVLEGETANKDGARRLFRRPGLLLIATHGNNVADRPLRSTLLLCPGKDDDGRLTAGEIYDSEVKADLVVLGACYSGLADRSPLPGDDLFGLQRAFLEAGARGVVSGQWDVYDGTEPELMKGLFRGVAEGKSAPAALAASQRAFLARLRAAKDNSDPWTHPYFWAVFTAAGDDRAAGK